MSLIQQGDVLFFSAESIPKKAKKVKQKRKGLVTFAEGEVTGHYHACSDAAATMFSHNDEVYCEVKEKVDVTHQEHKPVTLDPGIYKVGIVREVDPFEEEIRNVSD